MKKRLTLKIAGVLLTVVTVLQLLPVYAEGTSEEIQTASMLNQTVNPYQISVEEVLAVQPQLANKLMFSEEQWQIPDVMNAYTLVNQVKARRANIVASQNKDSEQEAATVAASRSVSADSAAKNTKTASSNSSSSEQSQSKATSSQSASKTITVAGRAYTYKKVLNVRATAYTADPSENGWGAVDALGNDLKLGTVAVDPNVIPLGTKLFITGYQFKHLPHGGYLATASDTGSAIKGNKVDLFVPVSKEIGNTFGIQNIKVYILK